MDTSALCPPILLTLQLATVTTVILLLIGTPLARLGSYLLIVLGASMVLSGDPGWRPAAIP
jgi:hypothetical protein